MILFKNCDLYSPEFSGTKDILIAGSTFEAIENNNVHAGGFIFKEGNINVSITNQFIPVRLVGDQSSRINGANRPSDFKIYPNPAEGDVSIDLSGYTGDVVMRMYCSTGKLITQNVLSISNLSNYSFSTGFLNKGIYFIELSSDLKRETVKLIKK